MRRTLCIAVGVGLIPVQLCLGVAVWIGVNAMDCINGLQSWINER